MTRALAILLLAAVSAPALAHGGWRHGGPRVSFGLHFGVPFYAPYYASPYYAYPAYYPAPVYYPPAPLVVQPSAPPVYVERGDVVPEGAGTWYFCRESNAYYPYVKQCAGGWTRVPAQPSN